MWKPEKMPHSLALALTFIVDRTLSLTHTHTYAQTYAQILSIWGKDYWYY